VEYPRVGIPGLQYCVIFGYGKNNLGTSNISAVSANIIIISHIVRTFRPSRQAWPRYRRALYAFSIVYGFMYILSARAIFTSDSTLYLFLCLFSYGCCNALYCALQLSMSQFPCLFLCPSSTPTGHRARRCSSLTIPTVLPAT
jgi:hypothetical protein